MPADRQAADSADTSVLTAVFFPMPDAQDCRLIRQRLVDEDVVPDHHLAPAIRCDMIRERKLREYVRPAPNVTDDAPRAAFVVFVGDSLKEEINILDRLIAPD
jgi:hypothetical protein